jgi:hypothetical protein
MSDEKAYEWFCEQYDANDSLRVHPSSPQDEVARARAALDAAEALVRSLKHKKSVISAGGKRMGQPATLHADAPDQDVVEIKAMILTGTLSSLHKAAQLMEQDAEERPTVWMEELKSRTVDKILSKLEQGLVEEDVTRAWTTLSALGWSTTLSKKS